MLCNLPIYHNFKQLGIRSVQLIPHLEFDDRGDLTAASVTAELWGNFNCPVRVLGAGRYQSYFD